MLNADGGGNSILLGHLGHVQLTIAPAGLVLLKLFMGPIGFKATESDIYNPPSCQSLTDFHRSRVFNQWNYLRSAPARDGTVFEK